MTGQSSKQDSLALLALLVLLPVLIFAYPLALGIPILDPAEGLHASIAQEMVEHADWVTPRFLGKPFLDKPILYFWAEALSMRLFGMNEAALRLPGLMFGLLGALTTGLLAWRMAGRSTAVLAALFYATTILPTALAQAAAHDVALIPWINLAILAFWESQRAATRRGAWGCTLAAGLSLGLACLTKGLVGVAVAGVAYGSYLLVIRRLNFAACGQAAAALTVAALVACPWYIVMEIRNPGYSYYFFVARHVLGYVSDAQPHADRPFWYYLPILLAGGLPWIAYLPATLRDVWLRRKQAESGEDHRASGLLLCWAVGCTLLLSVAHSKQATYIWPVFPPLAILSAIGWGRFLAGSLSPPAERDMDRTFRCSSWIAPLVLPAIVLAVGLVTPLQVSWRGWLAVLAGAVAACAPLVFWHAGRRRAALAAFILTVAVEFAVLMAVVVPGVAAYCSGRDLAQHFNARGQLPPHVLIVEERVGSIVFYLDRSLRDELRPGQLASLRLSRLDELLSAEPGTVVAVPERWVPKLAQQLRLSDSDFQQAGRYRLYDAQQLVPILLAARGRDDRPSPGPRWR